MQAGAAPPSCRPRTVTAIPGSWSSTASVGVSAGRGQVVCGEVRKNVSRQSASGTAPAPGPCWSAAGAPPRRARRLSSSSSRLRPRSARIANGSASNDSAGAQEQRGGEVLARHLRVWAAAVQAQLRHPGREQGQPDTDEHVVDVGGHLARQQLPGVPGVVGERLLDAGPCGLAERGEPDPDPVRPGPAALHERHRGAGNHPAARGEIGGEGGHVAQVGDGRAVAHLRGRLVTSGSTTIAGTDHGSSAGGTLRRRSRCAADLGGVERRAAQRRQQDRNRRAAAPCASRSEHPRAGGDDLTADQRHQDADDRGSAAMAAMERETPARAGTTPAGRPPSRRAGTHARAGGDDYRRRRRCT